MHTIVMASSAINLLITTLFVTTSGSQELVPLQFSLMVSNATTFNTSGVVHAVDNVLGLINNDSTILPGYKLQYELLQHECNLTQANELFLQVNYTMLAIVGCGCSTVTEILAKNQTFPIISYASSSSVLSDRSVYPTFFRTVPSDEVLAPALVTLMNYYGWRKVAILTENEPQFEKLLNLVTNSLMAAQLSVSNVYITKPVSTLLNGILDENEKNRVLYINTSPSLAVSLLCKAYNENMLFPSYVWISPSWFMLSDQNWWTTFDFDSQDCSLDDVLCILNRSLVLTPQPMETLQNTTTVYTASDYATDAVLSIAYALNSSWITNSYVGGETSTWVRKTTLSETTTVTGKLTYDMEGNREQVMVLVKQYRFSGEKTSFSRNSLLSSTETIDCKIVAVINKEVFVYINGENNSSMWLVDDIPPIITKTNVVKLWAYGLVVGMVVLGMTFSLICLIFNIVFKNRKIVKLTSPNLNYIIIISMLCLQSVNLISPIPSAKKDLVAILCNIAKFIRSIAYDIFFVIALVKTIRVVYILKRSSPMKKSLTDCHLLLIAMGIILIDFIFTVPLLTISYLHNDTDLIEDKEVSTTQTEEGYTVKYSILSCGITIYYRVWLVITVVYKLSIHFVGATLAIVSRKAKVDPFNDAKYNALIVYASCVILTLTMVILLTTNNYVNIHTLSWTTLVFGGSCTILGLTFIPKMVALYKDPRGLTLFTKTGTCTVQGLSRVSHYPTISEIGTTFKHEDTQEEMKEEMDDKENGFPAHGNLAMGNQITSTALSTIQKGFKERNNAWISQESDEIEAQDGKTEQETAEDANIPVIQVPPMKKGISWQLEYKT